MVRLAARSTTWCILFLKMAALESDDSYQGVNSVDCFDEKRAGMRNGNGNETSRFNIPVVVDLVVCVQTSRLSSLLLLLLSLFSFLSSTT